MHSKPRAANLMSLGSRSYELTAAAKRLKGVSKPGWYWLSAVLVVCLTSSLTLTLPVLIDNERLVPISIVSLLQAVPLIVLLYLAGAALIGYLSSLPHRLDLFTMAFLLRVIVGIILALSLQHDDERVFHATGFEQTYGLFSWNAGLGYYHLVNILYAIFGPNILLPKMVNALIGSLLPFFAYDIGRHIFHLHRASWLAFLFTAFLPPLVIYSSVNLKEIATAFLLVLTLWFLIVPIRLLIWKITGVLLSLGAMYWLRGEPWTVIPSMAVVLFIIFRETQKIRSIQNLRYMSNLFFGGLLVLFILPFLIKPISGMVFERLNRGTYYAERFENSSATVMQFVDVSNPLSTKNLGVLLFRGLYSPSPIRFIVDYGLDTIIEAPIMIVWYILFPFAMVGIIAERHKGAVIACGVIILGVLTMTTMGIMLGSDPFRHRVAVMGVLFIFAGRGVERESFYRNRWVFYIWGLGASLYTVAWVAFRI